MPRILLWDLDGTLACWLDPVGLTAALARCWLGNLHNEAGGEVSLFKAALAAVRGFRRVLTNAGRLTNDEVFNRTVAAGLGWSVDRVRDVTRRLLADPSQEAIQGRFIRPIGEARDLVRRLAERGGFRQMVATNPVMPSEFNRQRLARAGYRREWFEFVSGSEYFVGQKTDVRFYRDLLARIDAEPRNCLMIGDHPRKDGVAKEAGIPVFLLRTPYSGSRAVIPGLEPAAIGDYSDLERMLVER